MPVQSILDPVDMPLNVKADAFDAYHAATDATDLQKRLDKLPLPNKVKADLWDSKQAEHAAAPAAPAAGGFWHNLGQVVGGAAEVLNPVPMYVKAVGAVGDLAKSIHDGDLAGTLQAFEKVRNPATSLGGMGQEGAAAMVDQGRQAVDLWKQGRYTEAVGHGIAAAVPGVGPAAAQAGELIGQSFDPGGDTGQGYRGAGQATGLLAGALLPHAIEKAKAIPAVARVAAAIPPDVQTVAAQAATKLTGGSPRPLSAGAQAIAEKFGVDLTQSMRGGSKTAQAVEKMLGHSVAPLEYESLLARSNKGVGEAVKDVAGGFAVDPYTAGDTLLGNMLETAKGHETAAQTEYNKLRDVHETNPDNVRSVQVGMKENPSTDPGAPAMIPDVRPVALPTDIRPVRAAVAGAYRDPVLTKEILSDPELRGLRNLLAREDALPATTAEAYLGQLKEIGRSKVASPQAKRLAAIAGDALQPAVESAVSIAGPDAVESLQTARGSWAARSSILDQVNHLSGGITGKEGQVLAVNKLVQPSDANFPELERVMLDAPGAAQDIGKAFLTDRVFTKTAAGGDFTDPTQAKNRLMHLGPRTRAALFSPEQWNGLMDTLELAQRVAENPNPSGTGIVNTLLKMGVMMTHPVTGAVSLVAGRKLANLLYYPKGIQLVETALRAPNSPAGVQAAGAVTNIMNGTPPAAAPAPGGPPPVPPPDLPPAAAAAPAAPEPPPLPPAPAAGATIPTNATTTETTTGNAGGALDAGTAQPGATLQEPLRPGGKAVSRETVVTLPGEARKYAGKYELRELADVQASHNPFNFQPNPKYGLINDRNYDNPVNQAKIVNWSVNGPAGFDPSELINDARNASTGPPVLESNGNILGGNGRGMILKRVYKANPAGAQAYRDLLTEKAAQFGIDPAEVAAMKEPVLTRVLHDTNYSKQGAVTDFNKVGTAALTPNERAIADSRRVSTSTLDDISKRMDEAGDASTLSQVLEGRGGVEVLNNLIADGVVSPQERADLANEHQLTKGGKERIQALMTGRYFGSVPQMDNVPAAVRNKIERMAAPLAHVEGNKEFNLSPRLQEAMGIVEGARAHGSSIEDYLQQQGMFADQQNSRGAVALAKQLLTRDPTKLQAAARAYAADAKYAAEYQGPGMFNEYPEPTTPAAAFEEHFGPKAIADEAAAKAARKAQTGPAK